MPRSGAAAAQLACGAPQGVRWLAWAALAQAAYFRVSFDYAKTLKPKATKRAPKS
jgi:hypothetical protein